MRLTTTLLAAALALTLGGAPAHADTHDAWLKTKAKIALLTTDGVSVTDVNVDVSERAVTMHGKVKTDAEKRKAEETIQKIDGVRSVRNLLQVVPENVEQAVKVSDESDFRIAEAIMSHRGTELTEADYYSGAAPGE